MLIFQKYKEGELEMSKYKFTYFLNTACAERRPQTRRDLIEDWKEEEREFWKKYDIFVI